MFKNLFWFERALRTALGAVMIGLGFYGSETILYGLGGIFFVTGLVGFCPLRAATGLSGLPEPEAKPAPRPSATRDAKIA